MSSKSVVKIICISLMVALIIIQFSIENSHCAPTNSNGNSNNQKNKNNDQSRSFNFLRGLFRRQTSGSISSGQSTKSTAQKSGNPESEADDAMSQTELEAQKFLDTLPNTDSGKDRPNTFRERVSDTFGVLREGVSNQFKTMRENWSDTMEDIRDTWSPN